MDRPPNLPGVMRWALTTLLVTLLVSASGCVGRMAADRLTAAPNRQFKKHQAAFNQAWTNLLSMLATNPLVPLAIPVGPPEATLQAYSVSAGDYHRRFSSLVEVKPDGAGSISLFVRTNAIDTFHPLPAPATVVVLHGYGMMKEAMTPWAIELAQAGFRVVAIDLRGHGRSTGPTIGFGKFETADLSQALDYLIAHGLCDERVGVLGVSYGATLALNWAAREKRVQAVVAIAPYDEPGVTFERFATMASVSIPRRVIRRAARVAADRLALEWNDWSGVAALRQMGQPVFLIGGAMDPICPPADFAKLTSAAGNRGTSLIMPGANHYMVGAWIEPISAPVQEWLKQRLTPSQDTPAVARN